MIGRCYCLFHREKIMSHKTRCISENYCHNFSSWPSCIISLGPFHFWPIIALTESCFQDPHKPMPMVCRPVLHLQLCLFQLQISIGKMSTLLENYLHKLFQCTNDIVNHLKMFTINLMLVLATVLTGFMQFCREFILSWRNFQSMTSIYFRLIQVIIRKHNFSLLQLSKRRFFRIFCFY